MGDHYSAAPWLTRGRDDELIRLVNTASFGTLIAAAETTDLRTLRRLEEACRAAADRLALHNTNFDNAVPSLAIALLKAIAARAAHNADVAQRRGRAALARGPFLGSSPCTPR